MKSAISWGAIPLLAAGLLAQTTTPSSTGKKPAAKAKTTTQVSAEDVRDLREALAAQQQQIQQLREEMNRREAALQQAQQQAQSAQQQLQQAQSAAADAQQKAAAAADAANAQKDTVAKLSTDLSDFKNNLTSDAGAIQEQQRRTGALEALVGRFRFSGDVRVRGENFNQEGTQDRNRARIRVRFGFDGRLNEDFIAGVALATGSLGDPTSSNETLTNGFDRKTIGLDRGFITYNPVAHPWLSLTGGKWAYSWQRTSATFDPDLNPEGFNEKFSFDLHNDHIQNVTVQGMELLYNEVSAGQDSYALGIQGSTRVHFGRLTTNASLLSLKWNRPDALLSESAFAVGATSTGFLPTSSSFGSGLPATPTPVTGIPINGEGQGCASGTVAFAKYPPCVFAPNGLTNATIVDSKGVAHFYSEFNYIDLILNNQIRTNWSRLPVNLLAEFLDNIGAQDHPLNTKGAVISNLGSQNKEYGFDFSVGQLKNKNDFQVGYSWQREEQDAAIASFVESDQRAPTNILQNRIYALWRARTNTVAGFTWWHGRTLNTNLDNNAASVNKTVAKAGETEPYLNRLQFDLIYTF